MTSRRSPDTAPKAGEQLQDPRKEPPVQAVEATSAKHQLSAAAPPAPPRCGQEKPHRDEDGDEGQKLHRTAFTSAATTVLGEPILTRSIDPGGNYSRSSSTAPRRTPSRWGSSPRTIIPKRRRSHHLSSAARNPYPTIYKPQARIWGLPTLPPPQRRPEREETDGSAVGGSVDEEELPFASLPNSSRGRGKCPLRKFFHTRNLDAITWHILTFLLNLSRAYAIKSSSVGSRAWLCLGHCSHCKPLSCKCKLGWSSQPPPDSRQHFRPCSSASEAVLTAQSDIRKLFVANEKIGVLLLNLGGPETLDDVQPFLFNLFADPDIIRLPRAFRFLQKPLAQFISVARAPKSKEGYASIGGGSPLRQITDAQGEALMEALCGKDIPAKVYVGMRYWHPFTEEAIEHIKRDGITKLVVLPLYPQFSISTSGSSLRLLESIFREDEYLVNMQHTVIPSWYQREGYIKAMATLIEKELFKFPKPQKVMIFFSAHGVPLAYVEEAGDPYKAEMEECVDLIMEELEKRGMANPCTLAYQSRVGPVEWLKPYTDETIIALGQRGVKSLLAVPISFVSEHIETLEEIDVEYKELALQSGIKHWERVPALGCEPTFISDLADAVIESLPYVGAMAVSNLEARQSLVPLGSVEELLAAYDTKRGMLPPPVIVWEWGWTKSAETWNGRAAMLAVLALLVLEVTTGHGFLHQWGILPPLP